MFRLIATLAILPAWVLFAQAAETAASKPDPYGEVPWGKEVDGLACRIIVPKEGAIGLSIPIIVEIKNVSGRTRYIKDLGIGRPWSPFPGLGDFDYATMTITDSRGAGSTLRPFGKWAVVPGSITPIAPGETKRFATGNVFTAAGEYRLKFAFASPKPAKIVLYTNPAYRKNASGHWEQYDQYTYSGEPTQEQVAGAWTSTVESAATIRVHDLTPGNFTVHEWGVFSTFNDAKYANMDLAAEWASLPDYFYRQFSAPRLKMTPRPLIPFNVKKPIVYFYTDQPKVDIKVKVSFSDGAPFVWWPAASLPAQAWHLAPPDKSPAIFRALEWSGALTDDPAPTPIRAERFNGRSTVVPLPPSTPKDAWLDQARIKGPAMFTTDAGPKNIMVQAPAELYDSERFIYYDGLAPAPDCIRSEEAAADSVTVRNSAKFAIANLILVDRRDAKAIRFARVEKIEAGDRLKIALKEVPADWPDSLARTFRRDLRDAGLFDNEAESVLAIWKKGLFDRPGITAIYLLPQSEDDRMLPLTVTPKPGKIVRVGIVMHGQLEMTPAIVAARVRELVAKMDNDESRVRDRASRDLIDLGPVAFPAIDEILKGKATPEAKVRLEDILKKFNPADCLGKPADTNPKPGK
jgi:hypothetical protein